MKILVDEKQLQEGIRQMAAKIRADYQGRPLSVVGVMIGSVALLADLIRLLDMPLRVELIQARGYRHGSDRPGPLVVDPTLLSTDIENRDVLLVDDIFDTGNTLWELIPQIDELGPTSVRSAVLLRKEGCCTAPVKPDYVGFDIPDAFVVGYGLDHQDAYRNLPYIAALESSELSS